jgi:hypothetical protein
MDVCIFKALEGAGLHQFAIHHRERPYFVSAIFSKREWDVIGNHPILAVCVCPLFVKNSRATMFWRKL